MKRCEIINTVTIALLAAVAFVSPFANHGLVARLHIQEMLICLAMMSGLIALVMGNEHKKQLKHIPLQIVVFLAAALLGLIKVVDLRVGIIELAQLAIFAGLFVMSYLFASTSRQRRWVITAMAGAGFLVVSVCVWKYLQGEIPLRGVFRNRHVLCGSISGLSFVIATCLVSFLKRVGLLISLALFFVLGLILPSVAWIAMSGGIVMLGCIRCSRKISICLFAAILVGILASYSLAKVSPSVTGKNPSEHYSSQLSQLAIADPNGQDLAQRYIEWHAALMMMKNNFIVGVGPGNYQLNIGRYYGLLPKLNSMEPDSQNGWLITGSTIGVTGLCMLVWLFWIAGRNAMRLLSEKDDLLVAGLTASLVAWSIVNIFTPIFMKETGPIVMIVLGILCRASSGMSRSKS